MTNPEIKLMGGHYSNADKWTLDERPDGEDDVSLELYGCRSIAFIPVTIMAEIVDRWRKETRGD